jgi:hypothetical protein
MVEQIDPLLWKGKKAGELSREEAVECAVFFHAANVKAFERVQAAMWRMSKMELGLSKEDVAKIDWWISRHPPQDTEKADKPGNLYADWRQFERVGTGYQFKGNASRPPVRRPSLPARYSRTERGIQQHD